MTASDQDLIREANRLAAYVLEGQARNYAVMRQLLNALWCVLVATLALLALLVVEAFRT